MFISKKKLNAIKNEAYMDGYKTGYEACERDMSIDKLVMPKLDDELMQKYLNALKEELQKGEVIITV